MADELRTIPEGTMLMINATSAPMLLKTTPYFREKHLQRLVNVPYHHPTRPPELPRTGDTTAAGDKTQAHEELPQANPQDETFLLP